MNVATSPTDTARAVREAHAALRGAQADRARVAAALATAHEAAAPHVEAELHLADVRARLEDALAAAAIGRADEAAIAQRRADVVAAERALDQAAGLRDGAAATAAGLQRRLDAAEASIAECAVAVQAATVAHLSEAWRAADSEALDLGRAFASVVARILAVKRSLLALGAPNSPGPRDIPDLPAMGPVTEAAAQQINPNAAHGWGHSFIPRTVEEEARNALANELDELTRPAPLPRAGRA